MTGNSKFQLEVSENIMQTNKQKIFAPKLTMPCILPTGPLVTPGYEALHLGDALKPQEL